MIQINRTNQIRWIHDGDKKTTDTEKDRERNVLCIEKQTFQKAMGNGTHNKSKKAKRYAIGKDNNISTSGYGYGHVSVHIYNAIIMQ